MQLNKAWRIIATGFCFAAFGLGGIILSVCVFPLQRLYYRDELTRRRIARHTVHYTFKFFVKLMAASGVFRIKITDTDKFAEARGKLVLANHPSLIDVVILISLIPNADCVVKAHLFRNPFMRGVIKSTGYISNECPEGLLRDCAASLADGNSVIIFPEGTRTTPGHCLKFKRGAANIALRCQAELMTVLINVSPSTLTKAEKWYEVAPQQSQFKIALTRNALVLPEDDNQSTALLARQFTLQMQSFFQEELNSYE